MDFDIRPLCLSDHSLVEYGQLLSKCFPPSDKFSISMLDWLYRLNPDGLALGFNAFHGKTLVSHYACTPVRARLHGKHTRMLLSLNTATHPEYQGKGLFTRLAQATYATAATQGFSAVYGVANANSTPGFIQKLGFQLVSPLLATVGWGSWPVDCQQAVAIADFQRVWSSKAMSWRCANPINPVKRVRLCHPSSVIAHGPNPLIQVSASLPQHTILNTLRFGWASPLRLHLGLFPETSIQLRWHWNIPSRWRPSPLNLIFRNLEHLGDTIDPTRVLLNFLDFDAY